MSTCSGIADAVGNMMSTFAKKIGNSDFSGALDILNSIAVGGIAFSISKFLKSVTEPFEGLSGILEGVTGILDGVRGCFETYQTTLLDVLVTCVPQIADGALQLVVGVLAALVTYTPQIVDLVLEFLIQILEGISNNLPLLIKAGIDVLMAFFTGIVDALGGIDTSALVKGIAGIGLLSAIMISLSAVAALIPEAMVGILGVGAVIAEMAIVLAAVGVLAQLPGLSWLIGEGGKLLQGVGTAIGQFVGGIVGGFMTGVSSQFPKVGADLSAFMVNITPFIAGANMIKPSMMDGVKALAETILVLTAADILQGLTSWFTGGSSLSKFGEELVPFGKAMKDFSLAIGNMDGEIVANAAIAGKTLAEMAATIPNTGAYLVEGFVNGIKDNSHLAEDAAREMAASAADAARHELDEHSPSKVGYQIGDFFGIAFVNAISDYADKSYAAGAEIATSAKLGLSKAIAKISDEIDDNIDTQPTIRPVLDLSSIEAKGNKINSLFNRTQALSIGAELNATRRMKYESQNEVKEASNNNTYSFTQNNYSPKALSRTEIYRQTKNQFSAMERTVKA